MVFSDLKERIILNYKGLSKKKYFIYLILMIICSVLFWIVKRDISLAIIWMVLFLIIIIVDLIFDLLGYFKDGEDKKKISIIRNIIGYVLGTIMFAIIIALLLSIF
jgi:hypothetical protein